MQVQKYKNFLIPTNDSLAKVYFPLAKFAKSQSKFCKMFPLLIPAVPITGIVSTTYWYGQYQLLILAVPVTGTDSTNKLKFFETAFGFPLAKFAKSQRLISKDNKSTRLRDNKIFILVDL